MVETPPALKTWKAETTAIDRVQSVATSVSEPQPASYIAEEALVAENTARNHLQRLVDWNILVEHNRDGTAVYAPDPLHARAQTIRDLLEEHDRDGLIELKANVQERIESLRKEYDADSPDALREQTAATDTAAATRDRLQAASDWGLLCLRLDAIEAAIENYDTYTQESAPAP
jgi:hypothetical protein